MAHWKAAKRIFFGSATDGLPLKGRLLRNPATFVAEMPDAGADEPCQLEIPPASQGIIVEESRQSLTLAYARQPGRRALRLASRERPTEFRLVKISWTAFKEHFEIECWIDANGQEVTTMTSSRGMAA